MLRYRNNIYLYLSTCQQILHSEIINTVSHFISCRSNQADKLFLIKIVFFGSSTIICQKSKDVLMTINPEEQKTHVVNVPVSFSVLYIWSPILSRSAFVMFPSVQVTFPTVSRRRLQISRTRSCPHPQPETWWRSTYWSQIIFFLLF